MAAVIRGELFEHGRRDLTGCRFDPGGSGRLFFSTCDVWFAFALGDRLRTKKKTENTTTVTIHCLVNSAWAFTGQGKRQFRRV